MTALGVLQLAQWAKSFIHPQRLTVVMNAGVWAAQRDILAKAGRR
jgi:hypothetical protein